MRTFKLNLVYASLAIERLSGKCSRLKVFLCPTLQSIFAYILILHYTSKEYIFSK